MAMKMETETETIVAPTSAARRLKLLLLSDLGGQIRRVTRLCEQMVCSSDGDVDAVLVCGGHVPEREPSVYARNEANAAAEGDMMALISRLETIVCRVLYVPGETDPPTTRPTWEEATPNLTQYSVNCFAKTEVLVPGVAVIGEERYMKLVDEGNDPASGTDLLIVLRDSAAVAALPSPNPLPVANLRVVDLDLAEMVEESTQLAYHHLEIVGGPHQVAGNAAQIIFPGSLQQGKFTILELEQRTADDSWTVVSVRLEELPFLEEDEEDDDCGY